jgi:hypothetical protein
MWDRQVAGGCGGLPTAGPSVGTRSPRFVAQRTRCIHRMSEWLTSQRPTVGRPQRRRPRCAARSVAGTPGFAGALLQKQSEKSADGRRPPGRTCRRAAVRKHRCAQQREYPPQFGGSGGPTPQLRDWRCGGVLGSSGPFKRGVSAGPELISKIGAGWQQTRHLRFVLRPDRCSLPRQRWAFSIHRGEIRGTTFKQKNHDHRCYRRPGVCRIAAGS